MMVSVFCLAYNHGKFIREALESFVMQKTNFDFEVFVHDDCSTDNTADIIREYAERYPDIIKPIYQTENQYSKGVKIVDTFIYPRMTGRYIASCEGDDCWIDENKLQKQVDFLEAHPEFVGVYANVEIVDENNTVMPFFLYPYKPASEVSFEGYQACGYRPIGQTSSLMYKNYYIGWSQERWQQHIQQRSIHKGNGDVFRSFELMALGRVYFMEDVFSRHRRIVNQGDSWTARIRGKNMSAFHYHDKKSLIEYAQVVYSMDLWDHPVSKGTLFGFVYNAIKRAWKTCNKDDIKIAVQLTKDYILTYGIFEYMKRISGRLCRDILKRLKKCLHLNEKY